ncbi:uracil phosphoribosyltransferase-domain-containing protein [Xylaria intraflava]|nr:uracil phosphoribosyltransferase-domain-containing protein [Xylaria intraflava]
MWRETAIDAIKKECRDSGKLGVVAGHLMFWSEEEAAGESVHTAKDLETYTHILYLHVDAEIIAQRRQNDTSRKRPSSSVNHLRRWQAAEIAKLRQLCGSHNILFCCLSEQNTLISKVTNLLRDFKCHNESYNLSCAKTGLDKILDADSKPKTMLVFDGDKTLTAEDTGDLFWATVSQTEHDAGPLKSLFGSQMGYSYKAFRQAVLLYEEVATDEQEFDNICTAVASSVTVHPDLVLMLRLAASQDRVGALVVTCGLRRVWEKVLEKVGLEGLVGVIGGGRIADGFVVNATVKEGLVSYLKDVHHMYVLAFGDSPLDLPMLARADHAIVVVGKENTRSKSMDAALLRAIDHGGLRANQLLLPSDAPPRLDIHKLPVLQINDLKFANFSLACSGTRIYSSLRMFHATEKNAARLLMTPTRDAGFKGPSLQEAHRRIGQYLAIELLPEAVGLETYEIPHVQGHTTTGFRLRDQQQTLIVALMRGGEPMACGIHSVVPGAAFFHGEDYNEELESLLDGRSCVILVDSVVNSGKTIAKFARPIRKRYPAIRIVVAASVVQDQCLSRGDFVDMLVGDDNMSVVALRLSRNKFTGKGEN